MKIRKKVKKASEKTQPSSRTKALLVAYAIAHDMKESEASDFYCLLLLGVLGKLTNEELEERFRIAMKAHGCEWQKARRAMFPDGALYRLLRDAINPTAKMPMLKVA